MNIDFQSFDIHEIGQWPFIVKVISIIGACVMLFLAGIWADTSRQLDTLLQENKQEETLKDMIIEKYSKAANLGAYKKQMAHMKIAFGALLRQLPEKTEVPGLIEDISHQGLAAGLTFRSIRLLPEKRIDFYLELPMEISVEGTYHELGQFVSNIAALPRIVTLGDFSVQPVKSDGTSRNLIMNITAKTYRYTEDDPEEGTNQNASKK